MTMADQKGDSYTSVEELLPAADSKMSKAVEVLKRELSTLRTGRATPALMENLSIDYYGLPTPLNQLATIAAPEARMIVIQPWDKQALMDIEKSLLKSDMGFNPSNDGTVIRVPIPPLSQERRKELVKVLKRKIEDGKVDVRNVRRDAIDTLRGMERNKRISEDDARRAQERLQKATDAHIAQIDQVSNTKEVEIMEI